MTNIYFCEDCQAYHLTSMDKRESRAKQRRGTFRQIQHKELEELRESVKANTHDTHNTRSKGLTRGSKKATAAPPRKENITARSASNGQSRI